MFKNSNQSSCDQINGTKLHVVLGGIDDYVDFEVMKGGLWPPYTMLFSCCDLSDLGNIDIQQVSIEACDQCGVWPL